MKTSELLSKALENRKQGEPWPKVHLVDLVCEVLAVNTEVGYAWMRNNAGEYLTEDIGLLDMNWQMVNP